MSLCVSGVIVHRFPHPSRKPELLSEWINIVGTHLTETDPIKIYNNKRVCDRHFKPEHKTSGHHLIWTAKPTLNLGGEFFSLLPIGIKIKLTFIILVLFIEM